MFHTVVDVLTGRVTEVPFTPEEEAEYAARVAAEEAAAASSLVPQSISRRQCAKMMLTMGLISGAEALDMTRTGTPPSMVQALLDQMPEADRVSAEIDFAADTYSRTNPLLNNMMAAAGNQQDAVDQFFIAAAAL